MLENSLQRVRGVEGVIWAVPFYKGNARAKLTFTPAELKEKTYLPEDLDRDRQALAGPVSNPFTKVLDMLKPGIDYPVAPPARWYDSRIQNVIEQVILLGLDDTSMVGAPPRGSLVGPAPMGGCWSATPRICACPIRSSSIAWDWPSCSPTATWMSRSQSPESDQDYIERLRRFLRAAPEIEMNDHRAIIVGVCEATQTFQSNPVVYTLYTRAKNFVPQERKVLSYILAKTGEEDGRIPPEVVARGSKSRPAWGQDEREIHVDDHRILFEIHGNPDQLRDHGPAGLPGGHGDRRPDLLQLHDREHQAVRGPEGDGGDESTNRGMILLQAAVVGVLGYGIGVGLAAVFGWKAATGWQGQPTELAFFTPWQLLPITAAAIVLICILSSLLCVQRVIVSSRPSSSGADVFIVRSVWCQFTRIWTRWPDNVASPIPPCHRRPSRTPVGVAVRVRR